MTSFLFRALIYYHVKRNNASQLKRFLQKSRQSCPWRAQYKQNAPKNRRKHRQLHAFCPPGDRANLERTVRSSRIELAIWARWDKNGLICARIMLFLRMEPPKERFRRAIARRSVRLRISRLRFFRSPQTTCRRPSATLWSPLADRYKRSSCAHLLVQNMRIAILMFTAWKFCSINYFYVLSIIYQ